MIFCRVDQEIDLRLLELHDAVALEGLKEDYQAFRGEWIYKGEAFAFIQASLDRFNRREGFWAGVWVKDELAGVIGLNEIDAWAKNAKIAYMIGTRFRGEGIMTRSVKAFVGHAFGELRLHRIEIWADPENVKSCAIPERLKFRKEGVLRDKFYYGNDYGDAAVYAVLSTEWGDRPHEQ
jgi:ribosomal-protein-serine acetyltransferase